MHQAFITFRDWKCVLEKSGSMWEGEREEVRDKETKRQRVGRKRRKEGQKKIRGVNGEECKERINTAI